MVLEASKDADAPEGARNVRIEYMYRDGGNYKRRGAWVVSGVTDEAALRETLDGDGFFVPDAVGMPMLTPGGGDWDDDVDHPFHTIESVEAIAGQTDEDRSFDTLLAAFRSADWAKAAVAHEAALS